MMQNPREASLNILRESGISLMLKRSVCPLLFCVAVANAGVIYSTFVPGRCTFLDGHFRSGDLRGDCAAFTARHQRHLDTIRIAGRYVSGPNNLPSTSLRTSPGVLRAGIGVLYGLEPYQRSSPAYSTM